MLIDAGFVKTDPVFAPAIQPVLMVDHGVSSGCQYSEAYFDTIAAVFLCMIQGGISLFEQQNTIDTLA